MAARRAAAAADARVIVFSTVTAALLQRPSVPYAVRFDSPASLNRPGLAGAWQRAAERRVLRGARVLLPWGDAAPSPSAVATVPLHVPVETVPAAATRDIDALAYAGYAQKRGLDLLMTAWASVAKPGQRLVVAGIDGERGEGWLREHGIAVPAGVEWSGLLERAEWAALLGRARTFVNASRREDHGLSQLEALAAGAMLVTVPSAGAYEALPIARRLDPRLVAAAIDSEALAAALSAGLAADRGDYAARAARELEPYSPAAVRRVFEERVVPALGLR